MVPSTHHSTNAWEQYVEDTARRPNTHGTLPLLATTDLRHGDAREPVELARLRAP